jgi:nicotinamidase-related amidase
MVMLKWLTEWWNWPVNRTVFWELNRLGMNLEFQFRIGAIWNRSENGVTTWNTWLHAGWGMKNGTPPSRPEFPWLKEIMDLRNVEHRFKFCGQFSKQSEMKALLIIDMQKVSFTPKTHRFESEKIIQRINTLSGAFRKKGLPVIFIQHDGIRENYCRPGTEEWEILDELIRFPEDEVISKEVNDAFYQTRLHQFLQMNNITELVITGCATDLCVDATVKSALTNDYNLTIISDAHTTADRQYLTATQIISHYNWIWSELVPTEGKVRMITTADYLARI